MDVSALVCSTSVSPQATIHNKQQSQTQNNSYSDFSRFTPDYKSADAQQVISNLPQVKACKIDHAYILSHREQLEIDPTLCSKCFIANKYFASPEPFVQDLYKKSCHWQKVPEASNNMDIKPYADLVKPYCYIENIEIQHPEGRPRGKVHIKRVFQFPQGSREFNHIARRSSLQALKTLQDKPHMAAKVTYKLRTYVNNGVLVKLTEFLKLPEVNEAGITLKDA